MEAPPPAHTPPPLRRQSPDFAVYLRAWPKVAPVEKKTKRKWR